MVSIWRSGVAILGLVAGVFHLWLGSAMPLASPIGEYFLLTGSLFVLGVAFVALRGSGILFKIGTGGMLALGAIDNGLLYYTRTYGLGFLFHRPAGQPTSNRTFATPPGSLNGTLRAPPLHGGVPWSTSWVPPGAVQFFVLQSAIIVVAAVALWRGRKSK
jgi:hypothetical protein